MTKRFGWLCIFVLCLATAVRAGQVVVSTKPLRIVLLVDSSSEVGALINPFRAGLKAFLEGAPEDAEIALITTGGQIRIRQ